MPFNKYRMMKDFENLELINYLEESKDTITPKAIIMKQAVNEIAELKRKRERTNKTDDEIIMDILFLNYMDSNNFMASILLWLFFWLDKSVFIKDINKLINERGSVLKSIRTIRNKDDNTFLHGLKS